MTSRRRTGARWSPSLPRRMGVAMTWPALARARKASSGRTRRVTRWRASMPSPPPRVKADALRSRRESSSGRRSNRTAVGCWRGGMIRDTRRWSRSQDEVSEQEHRAWLERMLSDPGTQQWIAEADGVPVGQIRLTREPPDAAELHVTVAPDSRGRRLGAELIIEAAARGLAETTVHRLIADVKADNEPSCRAFARAGFESRGTGRCWAASPRARALRLAPWGQSRWVRSRTWSSNGCRTSSSGGCHCSDLRTRSSSRASR